VASFLSLPLFRAAGLTDAFLGLMRIGVGLGMISLAGMRKVTAFRAIRDAIRRGYGYEDIRAALLGQDEEREPVTIGAKAVAIGGWLAAFGTSVVAWAFVGSVGNQWHGLVQIAADLAVIFIPLSAGRWAAARLTAPTLKGPSWWDRWWGGRLGKWMVQVAGGRGVRALPAANEATEVALGRAAEALFDALPAASKRQLGEIPGLLKQLEGDVQALRRQDVALTRALAEAAGRVDLIRDLESARKAAAAKLATALSALENLRIDLLRISAGQAAGPGLTEHLEAARRIGRNVDPRMEAKD
jgi:hypothetical protein